MESELFRYNSKLMSYEKYQNELNYKIKELMFEKQYLKENSRSNAIS